MCSLAVYFNNDSEISIHIYFHQSKCIPQNFLFLNYFNIMSDLEHIKKKLRDYGFYPDFSTKSKYFTKLKSYLGLKQANELLDNIDIIISSSEDPEHDIAHLVGQDSQL